MNNQKKYDKCIATLNNASYILQPTRVCVVNTIHHKTCKNCPYNLSLAEFGKAKLKKEGIITE